MNATVYTATVLDHQRAAELNRINLAFEQIIAERRARDEADGVASGSEAHGILVALRGALRRSASRIQRHPVAHVR